MSDLRRKCVVVLMVMLLAQPFSVSALDAASAQADCNNIAQAAKDAQLRYLSMYKPRVDPVQTFTLATDVCLMFITNFDIGFSLTIPSLGDLDAFLRRMATAILTRACQAATSAFNTAVNNAIQAVGEQVAPITNTVGGIPGVSAGITTSSSSGSGGVNVNGSVSTDNGAAVNSVADSAANRVVNTLK